MDRRNFLKMATMGGVALMAPLRENRAHAATYGGPYFILIHAGGGWDPTLCCDPKGSDGAVNINRLFTRSEIQSVGQIKFPPIGKVSATIAGNPYGPETFFQKYGSRTYVINGVDTTTGNHDTGTRVVWSGDVADGYPSFAAVVAAAKTPGNALSFISSGGYEATGGLTSLTRLGNVDTVRRIAYANRIDPANATNTYHSAATWDRINVMQRERLDDMQRGQNLPRLNRSMSALYMARSSDGALPTLANALPTNAVINAATNTLHRQALVALAGFKTGLAVSASLSIGGFDTHGNHDASHIPQLCDLLYGVDMIMTEIAAQGLDGKVVVAVGSDFGRTPAYNAQNGKDHWNITSMLFLGAGIPGGKVVGSTDDNFRAVSVNPTTLQPDTSGTRIRCDHIQNALRRLAGVNDSEAARKFPLPVSDMPLFK